MHTSTEVAGAGVLPNTSKSLNLADEGASGISDSFVRRNREEAWNGRFGEGNSATLRVAQFDSTDRRRAIGRRLVRNVVDMPHWHNEERIV
jgi:hypothetical protein